MTVHAYCYITFEIKTPNTGFALTIKYEIHAVLNFQRVHLDKTKRERNLKDLNLPFKIILNGTMEVKQGRIQDLVKGGPKFFG